jgi:translation initiation factor 1
MKKSFSSLSDLASALGKSTDDTSKSAKTSPTNSNDSNLVYSTDSGRIKDTKTDNITPSDGFAKVRRETKGRKGKGVIVISGLGLDASKLKELAKKLKKTCGTGGSVVDETIEVQGDQREKIKAVLEEVGFKVKFTGG